MNNHFVLLDDIPSVLRLRHYIFYTEQAPTAWIRRFILANGKRHPRDMGRPEVERCLSSPAVRERVEAMERRPWLLAKRFVRWRAMKSK